jgi:hypothetical protein
LKQRREGNKDAADAEDEGDEEDDRKEGTGGGGPEGEKDISPTEQKKCGGNNGGSYLT